MTGRPVSRLGACCASWQASGDAAENAQREWWVPSCTPLRGTSAELGIQGTKTTPRAHTRCQRRADPSVAAAGCTCYTLPCCCWLQVGRQSRLRRAWRLPHHMLFMHAQLMEAWWSPCCYPCPASHRSHPVQARHLWLATCSCGPCNYARAAAPCWLALAALKPPSGPQPHTRQEANRAPCASSCAVRACMCGPCCIAAYVARVSVQLQGCHAPAQCPFCPGSVGRGGVSGVAPLAAGVVVVRAFMCCRTLHCDPALRTCQADTAEAAAPATALAV